MANPQKEDGYTAIANEIMDALCRIRIPGEERQVLDAILRKTYGWNKCEDAIALSQFVDMTGLTKPHIVHAINGLLLKKVIVIAEKGNEPAKVYKFNKNFDEWVPLPKKATLPKKAMRVAENSNASLPKKGTTKTTTTKDTLTKDKYSSSEIQFQLADLLLQEIRKRNPNHKEPNLQTWAQDIDLMIRRDNRDPVTIRAVIEWCQTDSFWQNNILSTDKLRKQFDQLNLKRGSNGNGTGRRDQGSAKKAGAKAGTARSDDAEYPVDIEG